METRVNTDREVKLLKVIQYCLETLEHEQYVTGKDRCSGGPDNCTKCEVLKMLEGTGTSFEYYYGN